MEHPGPLWFWGLPASQDSGFVQSKQSHAWFCLQLWRSPYTADGGLLKGEAVKAVRLPDYLSGGVWSVPNKKPASYMWASTSLYEILELLRQ